MVLSDISIRRPVLAIVINLVILLVGGTKRRQQRDIDQAKAYWDDYKRRKKEGG